MIPRYRAWDKTAKEMHEVDDIVSSELEKAILCSELQARIIYQAFNSAVVSDLIEGKSINWIASHYGCDWSTIRNRIYENPGLVEVSS